jgi:hypothetical protein
VNINKKVCKSDRFLDLGTLRPLAEKKAKEMKLSFNRDFVLNGIAYDQKTKR